MEPALRLTVGTFNMATTRTSLGRISSVHEDNMDASSLGFVPDELLELEEGPVMQLSTLLSSGLDPLSNVRQVLHCNSAAREHRINQKLRCPVIHIKLKPFFPTAKFFEVSFCRSAAFSLKFSLESKSLSGMLSDMLSVKEPVITGDCNTIYADINPDHFVDRGDNDIGQGDNQVYPESAIRVKDQITAVDAGGLVQEGPEVFGQSKGDVQPPTCGRDTDLTIVSEETAGAVIVTNGLGSISLRAGDLLALLLAGEGRLDSLTGLLPGRDYQLRRQGRVYGPKPEIGFMVKSDTIDNFRLPCNAGDLVEAGRVMRDGIQEDISLVVVNQKFEL